MRRLVLVLIGVVLLAGQSPGPAGLTGAGATGGGAAKTVQSAADSVSDKASADGANGEQLGNAAFQDAIIVGGVVASVAAASNHHGGSR